MVSWVRIPPLPPVIHLFYNVAMTTAVETKQKHYRYILVVFLITIITCAAVLFGGYQISTISLTKAEKVSSQHDRLLYLSIADAFWKSEETQLNLGRYYLAERDYVQAAKYLVGNHSKEAKNTYLEAKYESGDYQDLVNIYGQDPQNYTDQTKLLVAKSNLKLGDIEQARKLLAQLPKSKETARLEVLLLVALADQTTLDADAQKIVDPNYTQIRYQLAYNGLNSGGFPHAALALLEEGAAKSVLDRDGLLALAKAEITADQSARAYETLTKAVRLDGYYPQTYRQLITVGEKLGKNTTEFRNRLADITW